MVLKVMEKGVQKLSKSILGNIFVIKVAEIVAFAIFVL